MMMPGVPDPAPIYDVAAAMQISRAAFERLMQIRPIFTKASRTRLMSSAQLQELFPGLGHPSTWKRPHFLEALLQTCLLIDRKTATQRVYFARGTGAIKIGFAVDVAARLADLQPAHVKPLRLLATFPGGKMAEQELHRRFREARVHGEWFRPVPDLKALVAQIQKRNGQ